MTIESKVIIYKCLDCKKIRKANEDFRRISKEEMIALERCENIRLYPVYCSKCYSAYEKEVKIKWH